MASFSAATPAARPLIPIRLPASHRDMTALSRLTLARVVLPPSPDAGRASGQSDRLAAFISGSGVTSPSPVRQPAFATAATTIAVQQERRASVNSPLRRWTADVWLAVREGGSALIGSGVVAPVYGASQSGAVLRYRLAPASAREPVAYVRAVHALDRREADLAAGLAVRPAPGIPVIAHVEARASRRADGVTVRPAAFLTAGFDEVEVPFRVHARGYAQGGYVGGRNGTAFADGSIVAERAILESAGTELGFGAGLWGGAQRGAARLDAGPSASLRFPLGEGSGRIAVDYRLKLAGNAEPASGAALTLSAGF